MRRTLISTALAAVALALGAPAAPAASRGPCIPGTAGPECTLWRAKVIAVHDGDTLDARIGGRRRRVRITGLNAMEQSVYSNTRARRRGECHALAATARLERLLRSGRSVLRLAAQDPGSRAGSRLRRAVYVRIGGRWVDVAGVLLSEGHALWLPSTVEWAWNRAHSEVAERAAEAGRRLWDGDACGRGPHEGSPLRLWVNWDAEGFDNENPNGEWVRIKNLGTGEVSLSGWWLRDSALRRFRFPSGTTVAAGGAVTVRVGRGQAAGSELFWGFGDSAFENVTDDAQAMGDGAYLFDPHGDLRAWMVYPCRNACTHPLPGLELSARPSSPESVTLRNAGGAPIDLEGFRLAAGSHRYDFESDSVVGPGESMVVNVGGSPRNDSRLVRHWGLRGSILDDQGDRVRLTTFAEHVVACHAWGGETC